MAQGPVLSRSRWERLLLVETKRLSGWPAVSGLEKYKTGPTKVPEKEYHHKGLTFQGWERREEHVLGK